MPSAEIFLLLAAGFLAGGMNAVAGGGTLLTFPTLLAFGLPAITANATSTLALIVGIAGSTFSYRRHLPVTATWVRRFGLVCILGGLLGAALLTVTPEKLFGDLVPFLLLFATVLFMAQSAFRRLAAAETLVAAPSRRHLLAAGVILFFTALYGGYFGAGIGILMLAVFGLLGMRHIHEMNAVKTVFAILINLVAAAYFTAVGLIAWPQAAVLTAGAAAGYFAGAHCAQKIPQRAVRTVISAIGLAISAVLFWRQFAP